MASTHEDEYLDCMEIAASGWNQPDYWLIAQSWLFSSLHVASFKILDIPSYLTSSSDAAVAPLRDWPRLRAAWLRTRPRSTLCPPTSAGSVESAESGERGAALT